MRELFTITFVFVTAWAIGASAATVAVEGMFPVRWADPEVHLLIQQLGSDDLDSEESLGAVRTALATWEAVPCGTARFVEDGDAPDPGTNLLTGSAPNGLNEVVWVEDESWLFGGGVLGVTAPMRGSNGEIIEADIAFNGLQVTWKWNQGKGTDLESVAVHELGHLLGLQHHLGPYEPWWDPPTMHPQLLPKKRARTLEHHDILSYCFLYPTSGDNPCEHDDDCPLILDNDEEGNDRYRGRYRCDDEGQCTIIDLHPIGSSAPGEACEQDISCFEGLDCVNYKGAGVCAEGCTPSEGQDDCPDGFYCAALEAGSGGVCLPTDGEIAAPSGICESGLQCPTGEVCLPTPAGDLKQCTVICDPSLEEPCGPEAYCHVYQENATTGGCFPEAVDEQPEAEASTAETDDGETQDTQQVDPAVEETSVGPEPEPTQAPVAPAEVAKDGAQVRYRSTGGCTTTTPSTAPWLLVGILWLCVRRRRGV